MLYLLVLKYLQHFPNIFTFLLLHVCIAANRCYFAVVCSRYNQQVMEIEV
jgi:hypothetical protein